MPYLYGFSIHRIQNYLFATNRLREILGASELVNTICEDFFTEQCRKLEVTIRPENVLLQAAGNIRCVFEASERAALAKLVRQFPRAVENLAPGLHCSQAVVPIGAHLVEALQHLDEHLAAQRNRPRRRSTPGQMIVAKARRTGGAAVSIDEEEHWVDRITLVKNDQQKQNRIGLFRKLVSGNFTPGRIPWDIEKIVPREKDSWLAIVHADGNSLGRVIQQIKEKLRGQHDQLQSALARFSTSLDAATVAAAQTAFQSIATEFKVATYYPLRPVVLGGDDLTLIIRADLALDFTTQFLRAFESETQTRFAFLQTDYGLTDLARGLTACAGIAYAKANFPFHYSVKLAEDLTKSAKYFSKGLDKKRPPSSLALFKNQSSFVEDLAAMRRRTQCLPNGESRYDVPAYLANPRDEHWDIQHLVSGMATLDRLRDQEGRNAISNLHRYVAAGLADDPDAATMLERVQKKNTALYELLQLDRERQDKPATLADSDRQGFPLYDLLQLYAFRQKRRKSILKISTQ